MLNLGLLGKGIQHSLSHSTYEKLLQRQVNYTLFDYQNAGEIPTLDFFFEKVQGLSITAPYKRHFLSVIQNATNIPAVNCIKKTNTSYVGTNTDYLAILDILQDYLKSFPDMHVSLLGDGITSEVVQVALKEKQIPFILYSRKLNGDLNLINLPKYSSQELIINACSRDFIFKQKISEDFIFWDLNYHFPAHEYLRKVVSNFQDGKDLLMKQAKYSLQFWKIA